MRRDSHLVQLCTVAFLFGLALAPAVKADVTGSILGTVTDPSSGVLVGVVVTATNLDTNLRQAALTNSAGEYRILALPVGRYSVVASLPGFQEFVENNLVLTVNEQRRIDIVLQVGTVQQKVEVSAMAVQVESVNSQLGDVVEQQKLLALPLNGRSYVDLLGLQPGVAPVSSGSISQDRPVSGELSAGNQSVNGQREAANSFLVNGGDVQESRNMGTALIPNIDSVAEFRLITNSFDAEYGRFSGAIMNAITKSGSNGLHGTGFEFLRNDDLDARGFFDPARGSFKRNQFGYAVGGPFLKNRLFWFTDYQGTREVQGISSGNILVPTVAMRGGDFSATPSALSGTVNGPYWAQVLSGRLGYGVNSGEPYAFPGCNNPSDCVFPGNIIPQRAFAPTTLPLEKYIGLPNSGLSTLTTAGQNDRVTDDKAGQRVDFNNKLTGNWMFYYMFDGSTVVNPFPRTLPGFPGLTPTRAQQGVVSNTHVFGPAAVNEARLSVMRMSTKTNEPEAGRNVTLSSLGFVEGASPGIIQAYPQYEGVPTLSFNNFSVGNSAMRYTPDDNWLASDGFSLVRGRHTMRFGGEFRFIKVADRNVSDSVNGSFSFDGSETGSDWGDFLLGAPASYVQEALQYMDTRTKYGAAYAQDSFRVMPNLTINYGLRWEASMPWYDTENRIETLIPGVQSTQFPTAPLGWLVPGDPTNPNGTGKVPSTLAPTDYKEFGPRIGLAWSPNGSGGFLGKLLGGAGNTSIRAAYGIYYTAVEDLTMFDEVADAPYGQFWDSPAPVIMQTPFITRSDGSNQGVHFPYIPPVPGSPANKTLDYSQFLPIGGSPGYWYQNRQPYAEHYNFIIQRQLGPSMVMSLGYVATEGHRLLSNVESNPGNAALCLSLRGAGVKAGTVQCAPHGENTTYTLPNGSQVLGTRAPYGDNFTSNSYEINTANSKYNSFQASLQRKAANFTFLASYTYGKVLTDSSAYGQWMNFTNYALSKSLAEFDMTHNFVVSYAYELPFRRVHSLPTRLTQGWTLNGITRFTTGFPVFLSQNNDQSLVGSSGSDVPNVVGPVVTQNPRLPANRQGKRIL